MLSIDDVTYLDVWTVRCELEEERSCCTMRYEEKTTASTVDRAKDAVYDTNLLLAH